MKTFREILNIAVSSLIGILIILFILMVDFVIFPIPEEMDTKSLESIAANMDQVSDVAFVLIILSYIFSSYVSGYISSKIRTYNPVRTLYLVGVVLTLAGFAFFVVFQFPLYVVLSGSVIFFPVTRFGGHVGLPKRQK